MSRIQDELKQTFDQASLQHRAKKLTGEDWQEYQRITERHQQTRQALEKDFEIDQPDRVARETRRLINEAGSRTLELKHKGYGADRFNRQEIHRRAHNRVLDAHRRDLDSVDQKETQDLQRLVSRAEARQQDPTSKQDFNRAVDRRSGQDRRQSFNRHLTRS